MARQKLSFEEQRKRAKERLERAKARFAKLESTEKQAERKRDTRRKILLGSFVDHLLRNDPPRREILKSWCRSDLEGFLKPHDTALFPDLIEES